MKTMYGVLAIATTLAALFCLTMFFLTEWFYYRDVTSIALRAYSAPTASESLDYLEELKQVLMDRDLDEGYTAFWFNSPTTDLSMKMRQLNSAISRMEALAEMEVELGQQDMAYQMGMQEMIEELSGPNGITGQYSQGTLAWKPAMKFGLLWWGFLIACIVLWCLFSIESKPSGGSGMFHD